MVRLAAADLCDGGGHSAAAAQFSELKGLTGDDVLVLCENVARPRGKRGKPEVAEDPASAAGRTKVLTPSCEARRQLEQLGHETTIPASPERRRLEQLALERTPAVPPLPSVVAHKPPPGIVSPAHLCSASARTLLRPSSQSRASSRRLGGEACPRMSSVPELRPAHDLAPARASSAAELRAAQRSSRRLSGRLSGRLSSRRPAPPPGMPPGLPPDTGPGGGGSGDGGEVLVPRGTPPAVEQADGSTRTPPPPVSPAEGVVRADASPPPPLPPATLSPGVPRHAGSPLGAGSPSHTAAARSPPKSCSPPVRPSLPRPSLGRRLSPPKALAGAGALPASPQSSPGQEGGAEGGAGSGRGGSGRPLAGAVGATALFSGEPIASAP